MKKPDLKTMAPACQNCAHYRAGGNEDGEAWGDCLRYPPQILHDDESGPYSTRPVVDAADPACGEFRAAQ